MPVKKRVSIVSLKVVRENSILYEPRNISSPIDAYKLITFMLDSSDREKFIVISLDTKNQPVCIECVSIGTLNASLIHPREVFKTAILHNAHSVLLAHNHPSTDPVPSKEDIMLTQRLVESGRILGINILDHIVFGSNTNLYSFKEHDEL